MRILALGCLASLAPAVLYAQVRPVHTYSIVARDSATGQLGVAVQSHWFSVGSIVTWAEAGVGAVATQSFVDPSYGALGLELMRTGKTAPETLKALLAGDAHPEVRQVGMVDARGNVAVHTGDKAIAATSHQTGRGYTVQSNMMLKPTVASAMARAYESSRGDLTERLMAALEAAQNEQGDIRGQQSAAILVVSGTPTGRSWSDRLFDLRVEDHATPVRELRRLVHLARAYQHMNAGDDAVTRKDIPAALKEYTTAASMVPDEQTNGEMVFWHAVMLVNAGRVDESLPLFARAFAQDKNWIELARRLVPVGQLPDDPAIIKRIIDVTVPQR
jgi:uncharacterized Ntn-hydrolase superfamily protein